MRVPFRVLLPFLLIFFAECSPSEDREPAKTKASSEARILVHLSELYPASQIDAILETLPALERHFEEESVRTPRQALRAHFQEMNATDTERFEEWLRAVFLYAELIRLLGNELPNGYHDLTFDLPASKKLYAPTLSTYGLDLDATANDVASSLSTYDDTKLRVHTAIMISEMDAKSRTGYLERLVNRAAQMRQPQEAEANASEGE